MVPIRLKIILVQRGLWGFLVNIFDSTFGARNIWRFNEHRRSRFLKSARHTESLVTRVELEDFLTSVRPINTEHELIRVGANGDGGYLVPNILKDIDFVFSPGVANTATFEEALIAVGIPCYLADYSVEVSPISGDKVDFEKKFIGRFDNEMFMTMDTWIKMKKIDSNNLLLQMDIEGAEWDVFDSMAHETLLKFRVIVIEFHNLHLLFFRFSFERIKKIFELLLNDFYIVHYHPNNNDGLQEFLGLKISPTAEITFLRKDSCSEKVPRDKITHLLDTQNSDWKPFVYAESTFNFDAGLVSQALKHSKQ